jgi:transcriptional regulator with XRE-family HTH domain
MSGNDFKEWMKKRKLRVADVAARTNLDPNTVYAFRRGESVRRTTVDIINRFVREYDSDPHVERKAFAS